MTETFIIQFTSNNYYRIVHQPEISFSCYNILDNISIHSISYPDSKADTIWLRGDCNGRDDIHVQIFPKHLRALEELCRRQHWRFVICLY